MAAQRTPPCFLKNLPKTRRGSIWISLAWRGPMMPSPGWPKGLRGLPCALLRSGYGVTQNSPSGTVQGVRWEGTLGGHLGGLLVRGVGLFSLAEFLDESFAKRRNVVRVAAGGQVPIRDHFFIYPMAAGVADVGAHRRPRGERFILHHSGLDQHPRPVANSADRLA